VLDGWLLLDIRQSLSRLQHGRAGRVSLVVTDHGCAKWSQRLHLRDYVEGTAGVELNIDMSERLESGTELRTRATDPFAHGTDAPVISGENSDDAIGLAKFLGPQHHTLVPIQAHRMILPYLGLIRDDIRDRLGISGDRDRLVRHHQPMRSTPAATIIQRIDAYLDQVPRSVATTEQVGPFTLFVGQPSSWPYYGRPTLPATDNFSAGDVQRLVERQRQLEVPETIEAIAEAAPTLKTACLDAGLTVHELPLLVHRESIAVPVPDGIRIRRLSPDDPAVAASYAVAQLSFGAAGTAVGVVGDDDRDASLRDRDPATDNFLRKRMATGQTVVVVAEDERGVLATGAHNPVGDTTEIVGVATLPSARRQGLGAAITDTLVADAFRRGVTMVLLSAGGDDVARVYERVGFHRVATALAAESQ
jgi:ribosomal protein S18 acetylase RimI-like enzyme